MKVRAWVRGSAAMALVLVAAACTPTGGGGGTTNQPPVATASAVPSSGIVPLTVGFSSGGSNDPDGSITEYKWNFGDSTPNSASPNPSHTYTAAGTYNAVLTVTDNGGLTASDTKVITVSPVPNNPPTAAIAATPTVGKGPLAVSFDGSGSTDSDGTLTAYVWAFGDGNSATGTTASHIYTTAGVYIATLTVTDNQGATNTATKSITVNANQPPNAVATANHLTGKEPLTVNFSGGSSTDPDGIIVSYLWNFGDGTSTSNLAAPGHVYATFGTYNAVLTVTDDNGSTSTAGVTITVNPNQAPTAVANANVTGGLAPLTVNFTGSGSVDPDGLIVSYLWDFGDGNQSTSANPTHTYGSSGNFTASLTVKDDNNATNTAAIGINVSPVPNVPPVAQISCSPSSGKVPLTVSCSSAGSTDPDGTIIGYAWDFGDGYTATTPNASHAIAVAGVKVITLTVTDNAGGTNTKTQSVTVNPNQPPTAVAAGSPLTGREALTVNFSSVGSADPDGTFTTNWDFGDGTNSNTANPSHTYTTHGTYTATLTVTDDNGAVDTKTVAITVNANVAPTAVVNAAPQSGAAPLLVSFNGSSSVDPDARAGEVLTYAWDFGDGGSSTLASPSHSYPAGSYTASLTVTDANGASNTTTTAITVWVDADGDGYRNSTGPNAGAGPYDCNDSNSSIFPGAADPLDTAGTDSNCDGVDGVLTSTIFVNSSTGSDANNGTTPATAVASIPVGITKAGTTSRSVVLVANGAYARFALASGLTVRGGYPTTFVGRSGTTTVNGGSDATTGLFDGVLVNGISAASTLSDLTVNGGTGSANPSGVVIQNSSNITLLRLTVTSGTPTGAGSSAYGIRVVGSSAISVQSTSASASAGVAGASGSGGTTGSTGCTGAAGVAETEGNGSSCGGAGVAAGGFPGGGGAAGSFFGSGSAGNNGGNGGGGAAAGGGGAGGYCVTPSPGNGGAGNGGGAGSAGSTAAGGASSVAGAGTLWAGQNGGTGGAGSSGAGGGGAGGGGGSYCAGGASGARGGGGGAGGTGGAGGGGGNAGGASIALYTFNSSVTVDSGSSLAAAAGGAGGAGAAGGVGGTGGAGGNGASQSKGGDAGGGGGGGGGGAGGAGGGAQGGPSIAVFHAGTGTLTVSTSTLSRSATAASGGAAGGSATGGGAGGGGAAAGNAGAGTGGTTGPGTSAGNAGAAGLLCTKYDGSCTP